MKRLFIMALLVVGTMGSPRHTTAYFTSASTTADNTFTAATIQLGLSASSALVTFTNIYPGAAVYGSVTVQNTGNGTLWYSIQSTSTNGTLANALLTEIRSGVSSCDATGFTAGTPTVLRAEGSLGNTTGTTALNLLGDPTNSADAGNQTLAPTVSQTLCFRVRLPDTAASSLQGQSSTVTLIFTGVQKSGF